MKARIEALSQRHAISNSSRLSRASTTQTQITHRLLKLIQHLHLLIPALRSSAIRPEEEALRVKLEGIEDQIRRGRLRGKLNELWAVVGALLNGARGSRDGTGGTEWAVVDEEGLAQIAQVILYSFIYFSVADKCLDSGRGASRSTASNQNITTRSEGLGSDSGERRRTRWR